MVINYCILTSILVEELPVAPLGPLRQCQCPLSLHASILYILHPSLHLGWSGLGLWVCSLEHSDIPRIFRITTWYLVPAINHSVGEKVPSHLQPGWSWPYVEWAV